MLVLNVPKSKILYVATRKLENVVPLKWGKLGITTSDTLVIQSMCVVRRSL